MTHKAILPEIRRIKTRATKVSQPIGEFLIASMSARDVVEISYSDVRRLVKEQRDFERYLGIQRPINPSRIKKLKQYVESPDATFPTAIILAVSEKCAEFDEERQELTLIEFSGDPESGEDAVPLGKIAKVIDGQHRIAAFMDENGDWRFNYSGQHFDLNLAIFIGADVSEQAKIFATVNLAQTKVNKSLVYDLTELSQTSSPFKTCHNVAVMLDSTKNSPLFKRIKRLGTATPGRRFEPLTQASFVESLVRFISVEPERDRMLLLSGKKLPVAPLAELSRAPFRNLFIDGSELEIAEILFNYFKAVERKWPNSWNATSAPGNLLPKSNAFKALMRFLKDDVYLKASSGDIGSVPSIDRFFEFFRPIDFPDDSFTTSQFLPGSGGQSVFLKMLRGEVSLAQMTVSDSS